MYFKIQILFALIQLRWGKWWYWNDIKSLQQKRWKKLRRHLVKSPFYNEYSTSKLALEHYSLINKKEFMANFEWINTKGISTQHAIEVANKAEQDRDFSPTIDGITVGLSSGTSGNKGIFLASQKERAYWVACVLDRVIGFTLKKRSVAFFLRANSNLYSSVTSKILRFEFFDILQQMQQYVVKLNQMQPTILVAQPSILVELATFIEKGELTIAPSKVISVAEVLESEDARYLQEVFKQTIHQVYQCTEGMLATTCAFGYLHFNDDFLIIEKKYIDVEKTRFHPIITDLMRTTQPVIRYELNDILHEKTDCLCGSRFAAIEKIEGRSDDVLVFKSKNNVDVRIYPDFIRREIILAHPAITDYTIVQRSASLLELYIGQLEYYTFAENRLQVFLKSQGVEEVTIRQSFEKNHIQGNKLRRVQNDRIKS